MSFFGVDDHLVMLIGAAGASAGAAFVGRRLAKGETRWTQRLDAGGGAYRGGPITVLANAPRVAGIASVLALVAAATGVARAALLVFELPDLIDGPHRELGLVPDDARLLVLHGLYFVVALSASVSLSWFALRVPRDPKALNGFGPLFVPILAAIAAATHVEALRLWCRSIYWIDRMVFLSFVHACLLATACAAIATAKRALLTRT